MAANEEEKLIHAKGVERIHFLDKLSLGSGVAGLALSVVSVATSLGDVWPSLIAKLKELLHLSSLLISPAYAAQMEQPVMASPDAKALVNLLIMLCIAISFVWSLAVMFHSSNAAKIKVAGDTNKLLLGFMIGSAKSYLGLGG